MSADPGRRPTRPSWEQALGDFEARLDEWERSLAAAQPFPPDYPSDRKGAVVWPDPSEPIPRHLQGRAKKLFARYEGLVERLTARRQRIGAALAAEPGAPRTAGTALFIDEFV